jgi:hypothetical protein
MGAHHARNMQPQTPVMYVTAMKDTTLTPTLHLVSHATLLVIHAPIVQLIATVIVSQMLFLMLPMDANAAQDIR